jgi:hypothetical protein
VPLRSPYTSQATPIGILASRGHRRLQARFWPLPKAALVVNAWMMDDPTQPKPSDLLAVMLEFRDAVASEFARVDARFAQVDARFAQVDTRFAELESRMDGRFDRVERRLARLDDRVSSVDDRVSGMERRGKR